MQSHNNTLMKLAAPHIHGLHQRMTYNYPLIRTLHLDPQEIFYPELVNPSPAMAELQQYIADCTETEAEALLPIIVSVLTVLRKQESEKE